MCAAGLRLACRRQPRYPATAGGQDAPPLHGVLATLREAAASGSVFEMASTADTNSGFAAQESSLTALENISALEAISKTEPTPAVSPNLVLAQIGCGYWGPNLLRNFSA